MPEDVGIHSCTKLTTPLQLGHWKLEDTNARLSVAGCSVKTYPTETLRVMHQIFTIQIM